ncbi:relaxase/mobilization nuclease domain-containing protein [Woodsholea maritima]|uniref:relaxase/mobilization nuclease domain-containing protein n=1 Tax=Woodsholea maritima TaxID=240237 RepID=UPI000381EFD3|nr:hypothetical protein [Woodsholea maritima]
MILHGNQRAGARDLALHLLKEENDHVQVHELRGFASDDLPGALNEAYAISRGTRCKQFLFSLSLNPPKHERVSTEVFEAAIDRTEERLGLTGQPRAIVFHEKDGRRHAHAVWSRINAEEMKAVQLSHTHHKLREVSRELYREHGWEMPRGLVDSAARDPRNFSHDQWQQAQRQGKDPRAIKAALHDAWTVSDSRPALLAALEERGYRLARGDRRGFVAVDTNGEIYSLPKWAGVKTKDVRERVGPETGLADVSATKARIAAEMTPALQRMEAERRAKETKRRNAFDQERRALTARQKQTRMELEAAIEVRQREEAHLRQARFRPGLRGLWDVLRGESRRIREQNEREAYEAMKRDRQEKDALIFHQLEERRRLAERRQEDHARAAQQKEALRQQQHSYEQMRKDAREERRRAFMERRRAQEPGNRQQGRQSNRNGPDLSP